MSIIVRFPTGAVPFAKHGHHDQRSHGSWANGSSGDFQVVVGNEARAALASKIPAGDSPAHEQIRKALTSEIHMGETFVNSKPGEAIVSFDEDGNVNGAMSFITRDQKKDFYILNTGSLSSGIGTKMVRQLQSRAVAEDRGIILIPDTDTGSEAFWGKMGFHQSYGVWAMSSSQIKSLDLQPVTKHGHHDQKTHGSWAVGSRDGVPFSSDVIDGSVLHEPNVPSHLYHVAPRSAREDILANGLDPKENTWNTGAGGTTIYRDEHLWDKGDNGELFASEYRPVGVYLFRTLDKAREYAGNDSDIYQIDTAANGREIVRDPSSAHNWDYLMEDEQSYVTRYVQPSALSLVSETLKKHGSLRGKNYWRYHPNSTTAKLPDGTVVYSPKAALDAVRNGERPNILPSHAKAVLEEAALAKDDPDLTEIHVVEYKHFDVYGDENWGIARDQMPQVPVDQKGAFLQAMAARGVTVERGLADPIELKPVQKEISARKAGQIMQSIEKNGMGNTDADRLIVSSDGWVVDGHHRWAAATGLEFGKKGAGSLPVFKVGMTAKELLPLLVKWNDANGIARIGMGQDAPSETGKEFNKAVDDVLARQGVAAPLTKSVVIRVPLTPEGVEFMKHLDGAHNEKTHGSWANGQYAGEFAEWGERGAAIDARKNDGPTQERIEELLYESAMDDEDISDEEVDEYMDENEWYQDRINAAVDDAREEYRLRTIEEGYDEETYEHFWDDFDEDAVREEAKNNLRSDAWQSLYEERENSREERSMELAGEFSEVYDFTHTGTTVHGEEVTIEARTGTVYTNGDRVQVTGGLYDGEGNEIGEFSREFFMDNDGKLAVENALLRMWDEDSFGGTGFARAFNKRNEDYYISHGIEKVYVHAALEVGGYAWASQGFDWQRRSDGSANTGTAARRFEMMLGGLMEQTSPNHPIYSEAVRMKERLGLSSSHPDFPTPYELSQFGRVPGMPKDMEWPGKTGLLGTDWYGVKALTPSGRRLSQTEINYQRASSKQKTFDFTPPAATRPRDGDGDGKVLEGTTFAQWYDQFLGSGKN